MSGNPWEWLIQFCIERKFRFCPGADGLEPWVSYDAAGAILDQEPETVSKLATKLNIVRHPHFRGLVKLSSFEQSGEAGKP